MNHETVTQRLDRLESLEAIRQLKARYCAACDADHDPQALGPLFENDAVWEADGIGRFEGRRAIEDYFARVRASGRLRNSAHHAVNPIIEVNGDEASGHWRLIMLYTANLPGGEVQHFRIVGWYAEIYRRSAGLWRFRSLRCEVEEHAPYPTESARG
jgi:hypothetical protein